MLERTTLKSHKSVSSHWSFEPILAPSRCGWLVLQHAAYYCIHVHYALICITLQQCSISLSDTTSPHFFMRLV